MLSWLNVTLMSEEKDENQVSDDSKIWSSDLGFSSIYHHTRTIRITNFEMFVKWFSHFVWSLFLVVRFSTFFRRVQRIHLLMHDVSRAPRGPGPPLSTDFSQHCRFSRLQIVNALTLCLSVHRGQSISHIWLVVRNFHFTTRRKQFIVIWHHKLTQHDTEIVHCTKVNEIVDFICINILPNNMQNYKREIHW